MKKLTVDILQQIIKMNMLSTETEVKEQVKEEYNATSQLENYKNYTNQELIDIIENYFAKTNQRLTNIKTAKKAILYQVLQKYQIIIPPKEKKAKKMMKKPDEKTFDFKTIVEKKKLIYTNILTNKEDCIIEGNNYIEYYYQFAFQAETPSFIKILKITERQYHILE